MGQGAYYIKLKGTFKYGKNLVVAKPNQGNYPTGIAKIGDKFGKTHPGIKDKYYSFDKVDVINNTILTFDLTDLSGNDDDKVAADKVSADKAAADKVAADKAAADKVAADKAAADKVAADKAAADKVAADKAAADKVSADKAAADKVAADKVAVDKAASAIQNNQTLSLDLSSDDLTPVTALDRVKNGSKIVFEDYAKEIDEQSSLDILGQIYTWTKFGSGYALKPVSISKNNGIICRIKINGKTYIGNVYRNDRKLKDASIAIGDYICRASTDINNEVIPSKDFEFLSLRSGVSEKWVSIETVTPQHWETGEILSSSLGVCRLRKTLDPTSFYIGRSEIDSTGSVHCYLKKDNMQHDKTGADLKDVEVLIRPSVDNTLGENGLSVLSESVSNQKVDEDLQLKRLKQLRDAESINFG